MANTGSQDVVRERVAFALLIAQLVTTAALVPDWSPARLGEPVYQASWASVATTVGLIAMRGVGPRTIGTERLLLALFLGGMPIVYITSWLLSPQTGWLPIELIGAAIFCSLAWLGVSRWAGYLAAGILLHGVAWDLWHHGRTTFIPDWYTIGCLIADLGIGLYAALRLPAFATGGRPATSATQSLAVAR